MSELQVPEGFKPYRIDHSFNDVVSPLYMKMTDHGPVIGMHILKKHCNFVGFAHGGCLMTFMDIVLSGAVCNALGKYTSTPTVSINFDFLNTAKEHHWIEANVLSVTLKRTMGFVNATIEGHEGLIANVNACFKIPADLEAYPGMDSDEYHVWRMSED